MDSNFRYLEKYNCKNYISETVNSHENNIFYNLSEFEICKAEKIFGHPFPSQLTQFYKEIGEGYLTTPHSPKPGHHFPSVNEFIHPIAMVGFTQGHRLNDEYQHYMDQSVMDDLEPGDLPFFEIGDSCRFLFVKAFSKNPNDVIRKIHGADSKIYDLLLGMLERPYGGIHSF